MISKSEQTQSKKKHFHPRGGPHPQKVFHKHIGIMSPGKNEHINHIYNTNDMNIMFNTSQIPDNPGYMDFSNPTPPIPANNNNIQPNANKVKNKPIPKQNNNHSNNNKAGPVQIQRKQNWNQNQRQNRAQNHNGPLMPPGPLPPPLHHPPYGPPPRFAGMRRGQFNPLMNMPRRPMGPPPHNIAGHRGPMHPPHIPPISGTFKPHHQLIPPQRPPIHPGPSMPPPFMRRGVGGGPSTPMHPPILPQMGQRNRINGMGPMNNKNNQKGNSKSNLQKVSPLSRKNFKPPNKYTMRTLNEIGNQFHMDKPFVNDEIRSEYAKKVDIENRLKGKKDDKLFAEFKKQRDKFVALYNAAREKHAMTKSKNNVAKLGNTKKRDDKNQTKNMTAETEINKEAI